MIAACTRWWFGRGIEVRFGEEVIRMREASIDTVGVRFRWLTHPNA